MNRRPIVVALDYARADDALAMCDRLDNTEARVKIGKELFTRAGPQLVEQVIARGFDVFLDLKFHDIPNTVANACRAAADLGVWMMNVHAGGGGPMMRAAASTLEQEGSAAILIAVTVLTSLDGADLTALGIFESPGEHAVRLAGLAHACGLKGVVCSPHELRGLRSELPPDFLAVTPGIRPPGSERADQKRVMTPVEALRLGADYLVIGRPITAAHDPMAAMNAILSHLDYRPENKTIL